MDSRNLIPPELRRGEESPQLAKRGYPGPNRQGKRSDQVKRYCPLHIIDLKQSNPNAKKAKANSRNRAIEEQSPSPLSFLVFFASVNHNKAVNKKTWIEDLDELDYFNGDKIELLRKFRNHLQRSSSEPHMRIFCTTRLALLDEYLTKSDMAESDLKKIFEASDSEGYADCDGPKDEGSSYDNSNVLGSIIDNADSCWKSPLRLIDTESVSPFNCPPGDSTTRTAKLERRPEEISAKGGLEPPTESQNTSSLPPKLTKSVPVKPRAKAEHKTAAAVKGNPGVKSTSYKVKKPAIKNENNKHSAQKKAEPRKPAGSNKLDQAIKETTQEMEDRIKYILNIVMVEKILQLKKKYLNHVSIDGKTAFNELEKLKEVISSLLNEVERMNC